MKKSEVFIVSVLSAVILIVPFALHGHGRNKIDQVTVPDRSVKYVHLPMR